MEYMIINNRLIIFALNRMNWKNVDGRFFLLKICNYYVFQKSTEFSRKKKVVTFCVFFGFATKFCSNSFQLFIIVSTLNLSSFFSFTIMDCFYVESFGRKCESDGNVNSQYELTSILKPRNNSYRHFYIHAQIRNVPIARQDSNTDIMLSSPQRSSNDSYHEIEEIIQKKRSHQRELGISKVQLICEITEENCDMILAAKNIHYNVRVYILPSFTHTFF